MLTCFISKTHNFLKINAKIKLNPDAFSVFSTHIKYSSSKNFYSRTGNIMLLLFLWMPFFQRVTHRKMFEEKCIIEHICN